ncbi:hypothetical protein BDC45DRAFT_573188 [Circinella umbellata]|nr:hypothetical protein BDC45DRAFT_573188 [Circinella umbellata]
MSYNNRAITTTATALSIHLCPEFGWTNNTSAQSSTSNVVFGPGSVLKGFVRINATPSSTSNQSSKPDRLSIIFHASESLLTTSKLDSKHQHEQFFGSQRVLWINKDGSIPLEEGTEYPFIIQLPMVQFPPSVEIDNFYRCRFRLSTYLEGPCSSHNNRFMIAESTFPINYMPHIESRINKELHQKEQRYILEKTIDDKKQQQQKFKVQLNTLEYIAGDTITPLVYQPPSYRICMELIQEFNVHSQQQQNNSKAPKTFKHCIVNTENSLLMELPNNLIPSFSFGRMVSVNYKLRISFHNKEMCGISSLILSPLKSSSTITLPDIPIQIGTLAYGIKPSDELQVYTVFKSMFNKQQEPTTSLQPLPVPKYITSIEYTDALPLYENYELPSYQQVVSA